MYFPGHHSIIDAVQGIVPLEWVVTLQASGIPLVKVRSIASKFGYILSPLLKGTSGNPVVVHRLHVSTAYL